MNIHVKKWITTCGFTFDKMGEDLLVYTNYDEPFLVISKTTFCQKVDYQYYISLNKEEIEQAKQRAASHKARLLYFICIQHPQFGFLKYLVPEFSLLYFDAKIEGSKEAVHLIINESFIDKLPLGFIALSK